MQRMGRRRTGLSITQRRISCSCVIRLTGGAVESYSSHRDTFSLADLYSFEDRLASMHPTNRNVRPKLRQQLQVLRDHGVLEFLGGGEYRVLLGPQRE